MALITMPNIRRAAINWRRIMPSQSNLNEYTGRRQVVAGDRGWWECDYSLPVHVGQADYYAWEAFIGLAQNPDNNFQVRAEDVEQNGYDLGTAPGTLSVNGSSQTGRSFNVDGAPTTGSVNDPVLPAGAKITIEDVMYRLTTSISKTASSQSISVDAPLRTSPANNATIEWLEPYCLMYLVDVPDHTATLGHVAGASFTFREVV